MGGRVVHEFLTLWRVFSVEEACSETMALMAISMVPSTERPHYKQVPTTCWTFFPSSLLAGRDLSASGAYCTFGP